MKTVGIRESEDSRFINNFKCVESNDTLWTLAKKNKMLLVIGSLFSFFLISILLSGWSGIIPDLTKPYASGGDVSFTSWEIKRILEGGIWDNPRSGYPFGSNFRDYPLSDTGSLFVLKIFGLLTGTYWGALNLYLLTSFPIVFIFSFLAFRFYDLRTHFSFIASLLFTFTAFHCIRLLGHTFYTWYFVVPLYFLYAKKVFSLDPSLWPLNKPKKFFIPLGVLIIMSSFGAYYAFFGVITIFVSGCAYFLKYKKPEGFILSVILCLMITFGVSLNLLPNLIYKYTHDRNLEATLRIPGETEVHALKITPMLLPSSRHHVKKLRSASESYNRNFSPTTETHLSSNLGIFSSIGFLLILYFIFSAVVGRHNPIIELPILTVFSFLMIATTGGFSSLFALYVSPLIRGWNRISIFISFATLTTLFLLLQESKKLTSLFQSKKFFYPFLGAILSIGLFDQIPRYDRSENEKQFVKEKNFIKEIESFLPNGAIYQLPYMGFPEYGTLINLPDYALLDGYLHSETLSWNHGGMKGREGDFFYRHLAKESIDQQLKVIKNLGFNGIYVDRRGFADHGDQIIEELNKKIGTPVLKRSDNEVFFYKLDSFIEKDFKGMNYRQIMDQAGYFADKYGPRYPASLSEGIDFTRASLPSFIEGVKGLSYLESWGRWSDGRSIQFNFFNPLPNKFTLVMKLIPFGPNRNKQLKIILGNKTYSIQLTSQTMQTQIPINLRGEKIASIKFVPPAPRIPDSGDPRKLGIGFISMKFNVES